MVHLPRTCGYCGAKLTHYGACVCDHAWRGFSAPTFAISWERMIAFALLRDLTPYGITTLIPDEAHVRVVTHYRGSEWCLFDKPWRAWRAAFDFFQRRNATTDAVTPGDANG